MKNRISKTYQVPQNSLRSVKTAKSSLARGHMGGFGLVWDKACAGRLGPRSAHASVPTRLG